MSAVFPHGARVRIIGSIHGSQTVNVLHFGTSEANVDLPTWMGRLEDLCDAIIDCFVTHLLPVLTSDFTFQRVEANLISPFVTDPFVKQVPLPNVGEGAAQGATITAALVQLRTGRDGRKGRGRMFLPPGGENVLNNGEWDAPFIAGLTAFGLCLAQKFGESGGTEAWKIGILSRKDFEGVGGTWQNSFRTVQTYHPQVLAASMRTRKKGRGA